MTPSIDELSAEHRRAVEYLVGDFDERWEDGLLARRAEQIPADTAWRLQALAEMVKIDIDRQWRRGHESHVESYLEQFPELARSDDVSALILAEFEARRQSGAPADLEGYLRRFPEHAGEIARRIASGGSSRPQHAPSSAGWSSAPKPAAEVIPEQLGRYKILKRLGQGGMGSVFLAEDTQLGRKVALKVPHFGPNDGPDARERFFREARTAATLDHPYLCPVFDVGEVDGRLYLTMAFIEGKSLAESLKGEGMPTRQVAALVGKLALALQQAHAKGVVHRDLKPANVMIKSDGTRREPVIVDFGLALRDDGDSRMTKSGQVMGTLAYMSPEQVMGDLSAIGPPCDIFALGVILYELLTGRLPFNGAGLAIAGQILTQKPKPPSSIREDIDPRIEAICLKAMAKKSRDRYASMAELAAALTDFLKAPAVAVTESTPPVSAPSTDSQGPKSTGGDRLMAELFQGLATGDSEPRIASKPRKPSSRSKLLEQIETDEEVEPMLSPSERPPWFRLAIGVGALGVLCLVLALAMGFFKGKSEEGTIVLKNLPENPEVFVDGVKPPNNFAAGGGPYEVPVPEGKRWVEVRKNGLKVHVEEVTVEAGKDAEVVVKDEPIATNPPMPVVAASSPSSFSASNRDTLVGFATPDTRPTLIVSYHPTPPVLDGLISAGEYGPAVEVDFTAGSRFGAIFAQGDSSLTKTADDLSVRLHTAYTDRSLFLAFHVRDQFIHAQRGNADQPYLNDCVEIFLDGDRVANDFIFGKPAKGNAAGFQIVSDTLGNQATISDDFTNADWKSRAAYEPGGYVVEFEVPLTLINTFDGPRKQPAAPGSLLHLALAIDDKDQAASNPMTYAYIRSDKTVGLPFGGMEGAWSLGLKLEDRPAPKLAPDVGWKPLFNGRDLNGWTATDAKGTMANIRQVWNVRTGVLHGDGGMSHLFSPRDDYTNFRVRAEVKINAHGNSGLFFRAVKGPGSVDGYEAQINVDHADPAKTGSLYRGNARPALPVNPSPVPADTWCELEVLAVGNKITTFVDGKLKIAWIDPESRFRRGHIAIQSHDPATKVAIRKLEIQELDASGNPLASADDGFRPIFNGKDLAGWKVDGDVPGVWGAQDGQIVAVSAVPKNQTWLFSDDEYANFLLRFEVNMPNPSDSGVGIWAAFGEECPVELNLRNMAGGFAQTGALRWDIRGAVNDYHFPDRPASLGGEGDWNAVEVESNAGRIRFSINGQVITTANLAPIADQPNALPAAKRGSGRVGFQAHTGTVRFRNVVIKRL